MQRPRYANRQFYHVYNRGVEKRDIFLDDRDRVRFVHDLFEFNDRNAAPNMHDRYGRATSVKGQEKKKERKILIDIVAYALMPNHYHLLLRQRSDSGVSLFMQKLGGGYTMYFNERYERSGVLFQGRYKVKEILEDRYLRHLVAYIHLNPVELFAPAWKEKGIANADRALRQLEEYRWSSYRDYIGEKNFSSILNLDLVRDLGLPLSGEQRKLIRTWLSDRAQHEGDIREAIIEV